MTKVVVIEEDSAMRSLISEWLKDEGHHVLSMARNGPGRQDADPAVRLVVLDLPDPRSRGGETARAVQAVRDAYPNSAVVGISTQVARSLAGKSEVTRALGVSRLVPKPCTHDELLHAVTAALAE